MGGSSLPFRLTRNRGLRWLILLLTLCAACVGVISGSSRFDYLLYDRALSLSGAPAPDDIVIVAIDDDSINALGYWPWRRSVHAALLDRLTQARAVGLDIIFAEPGVNHPDDDLTLAAAIRRHGRVVLPAVLHPDQSPDVQLPIKPLDEASFGVGFINITPDSDSTARRLKLTSDTHSAPILHFSLAMLHAGKQPMPAARFMSEFDPDQPMLIPYAGGPGHFSTVSYLSVLRGDVPPSTFANKYVLVGAWATGLGDIFPTPVSRHSSLRMSGVEIIANTMNAVRRDITLREATDWQRALFAALPVLLLCLLLPRLSPKQTVLTVVGLMVAVLGVSFGLLHAGWIWLTPSAPLVMLMLCYPIWSWRSQEAALRHLNGELRRLDQEVPLEFGTSRATAANQSLEGRVTLLLQALERVRNLRRFLNDSLDGMPDATLLLDETGRLKFFNHTAAAYFQQRRLGSQALINQPIHTLLTHIIADKGLRQTVADALQTPTATHGSSPWVADLEIQDHLGRSLMLKCAPIRTARGDLAGTVLTLTDVTSIRAAERQREETMRFISHDMRAPQNSILALIDLHKDTSNDQQETLHRISLLARRTLSLVDDFVDLSSAESVAITPRVINLTDLLQDAVDELWAQAHQRQIRLIFEPPSVPTLTLGDDSLLLRALRNLVDNAVKYSPDNTCVTCSIAATGHDWEIRIADQGPGIDEENLENIFKPFVRLTNRVGGTGLGLAFVRIVLERHHGHISVTSKVGEGTCFVLHLPRVDDDAEH